MFGIVSWPALRTVTTRSELFASFCFSGNVALTTSTAKSPSGLVLVLSLASAAARHCEQADAATT